MQMLNTKTNSGVFYYWKELQNVSPQAFSLQFLFLATEATSTQDDFKQGNFTHIRG
jgi:hypothetical protein